MNYENQIEEINAKIIKAEKKINDLFTNIKQELQTDDINVDLNVGYNSLYVNLKYKDYNWTDIASVIIEDSITFKLNSGFERKITTLQQIEAYSNIIKLIAEIEQNKSHYIKTCKDMQKLRSEKSDLARERLSVEFKLELEQEEAALVKEGYTTVTFEDIKEDILKGQVDVKVVTSQKIYNCKLFARGAKTRFYVNHQAISKADLKTFLNNNVTYKK